MDTPKIPVQRLRNFLLVIFLAVALISFVLRWALPRTQPMQLFLNLVFKEKQLPLNLMAAGEAINEIKNNSFTGAVLVPKGANDFVLAGPYEPFMSGKYELRLNITPQCSNQEIGQIDAVSRFSKSFYATKNIIAVKEGEPQAIILPFEGDFSWNYEFRVRSNGNCAFKITEGKIARKAFNWRLLGESIKMKLR